VVLSNAAYIRSAKQLAHEKPLKLMELIFLSNYIYWNYHKKTETRA